MKDCIFCKIARNETNNYCVYEDNVVKAFLDINPWTKGHTLIIPKKHYKDIFDIPEEELKEIIVIIKRLSIIYRKIFGDCDINIIQSSGKNAQQDVLHFHMHLVPRYKTDKQKIWKAVKDFDGFWKSLEFLGKKQFLKTVLEKVVAGNNQIEVYFSE